MVIPKIDVKTINLIFLLITNLSVENPDDGRLRIFLDTGTKLTKLLKKLLRQIGCFDFYATNSGEKIIGVSQIIYYIYYGHESLRRGWRMAKGVYEIHHIDGDVSNNYPGNLIPLHVNEHRTISQFQRGKLSKDYDVHISSWLSQAACDDIPRFNRRGRKVKDVKAFLAYWLKETLSRSLNRWVLPASKRGLYIKEIIDYVEELVRCISNANFSLDYSIDNLTGFYQNKLDNIIAYSQ